MNSVWVPGITRWFIAGLLSMLLTASSLLVFTASAFAEEAAPADDSAPAEESSPEPEPTPEPEPAPTPSYTPPPEASEGVGGWAVVDPETGQVHGVIVGTIDTYNAHGGTIGSSYMGCSADCVLRFQTRATSDGNVAGWHGPDVTYNDSDQSFNIGSNNGSTSTTQKLVPAQTARDAAGMDLSTGFVSRVDTLSTDEVSSRVVQDFVNDSNDSVEVNYLTWGVEGTTLRYSSLLGALANHENDVDTALQLEFPAPVSEPVENPLTIPEQPDNAGETPPVVEDQVSTDSPVDEENPVVQTIRRLIETVMSFLRGVAGIADESDTPAQ